MKIGRIALSAVSLLCGTAGFAGCSGGTGSSLPPPPSSATTYTVTYSGNGATGGEVPVDGNKYAAGATVTVLSNSGSLVNTGYSFSGWNTAANGSGTAYAAGSTLAMSSSNVILYAQWPQLPTYTVTYSGNGATGGVVPLDGNKYPAGATVTVLGNTGPLVDTGHSFAGWNTAANGSGTAYAAGATFVIGSGNVTLYAQWTTLPIYSVTYSGNGNTGGSAPVDGQRYMVGATVTVLGDTGSLVDTGNSFAGWNTAANGSGTAYAAGATFNMGSANVTLYAQWSAGPIYSVIYNGNGYTSGTAPTDNNTYAQGATVTALQNTGNLSKTGYAFAGWNTHADGSGTADAPGATFTMPLANVTLYAQWAVLPTYSVTYNGNGNKGGIAPVDGSWYLAGATVTILGNSGSLVDAGYSFAGWNTAANGSGTTYAPGATLIIGSASVTLYAQWSAQAQYTVSYSGNGNTGGGAPSDSNTYAQGATVTVLGNTGNLAKTGYNFAGWNTCANGSGTNHSAGATFTINNSLMLYAQWTPSGTTYSLTYVGNGNANGFVHPDPNQYLPGSTATVLGNLGYLFKPSYSFTGWNTTADGTGTAYAIGATAAMNSNLTLYAQWSALNWPPVSIWGGAREAISLKADGTVWTWGYNANGQLGDGSTNNNSVPVQVLGPSGAGYLDNIVAVMGGELHNTALKGDGTVWVWGGDQVDQLGNGDGTMSMSTTPIQLNGISSVVMLGSRGYHSVAVKSDGTVWDWGSDLDGALGDGLSVQKPTYSTPLEVQGVANPIMVTAGYMFSIALMPDHTLLAWGNNKDGEIGNGTIGGQQNSPEPVSGINNVIWVSAGWTHAVAIRSDGTVWTWGANSWSGAFDTCADNTFCGYGKLGDGTTQDHYTPEQLPGLSGAIMALAGDSFTSVLLRDGTVWTFGSNGAGQLGVPNINQSLVPIQVQGLCPAIYIMARDFHNEAICADGSVWSWGSGTSGELGNGAVNNSAVPVQVTPY